jgi:hypothetical protein
MLLLKIFTSHDNENFEKYLYNNLLCTIIVGCYINPYGKSILSNNQVDFIVMDTTFRLLPKYVTSILYAVCFNTGIPIGVNSAQTESKKIYLIFYEAVSTYLGIDLKKFKVLSVAGKSLRSDCECFNIQQFFVSAIH